MSATSHMRMDGNKPTTMPIVRPWRSVLICSLLVLLAVLFLRDLGMGGPETLADSADGVIGDYSHGLLVRMADDPFRLTLAGGAVAAILYAVLQIVVLRLDLQALKSGVTTRRAVGRALSALAGRGSAVERSEEEHQALLDWAGDAIASPLRLALSAFPMFGFLGTVIGLSGAIEALPFAMQNKSALGAVLGDLHVAFDTTLLGLVGAIVCLIGARAIDEAVGTISLHVVE